MKKLEDKSLLGAITKGSLYINKGETQWISLKVTGIYLIVGALWILLSEKILGFLVSDKEMITILSMIKGWLYVAVTGVLIYILINSLVKRSTTAENELIRSYQRVSTANTELEVAYEQLTTSQIELEQQYIQSLKHQKQLQHSEERYKLISEATNDAIWEEVGGTRYFSDRWYDITGYSKKDLEEIGGWEELIHPADKISARELMLKHIRNMTPYYQCEYRPEGKLYSMIKVK